jgi:HlyD family secretion protein
MKKHIKIIIIVAAVALIAVAAYFFLSGAGNSATFKTEKLERGDITETITASGTVNAVVTVLVGTQVSGTISKLYVDYNSQVKKGQLLAKIDPLLLQAQVDQANANMLKLVANTADAKKTRDRNRQLFAKNLIARSDVDTADSNYDAFVAQVSAARASLNAARVNLKYTDIVSPVDGIVISKSIDVGQTVAASFQTPTLFTIAQDLTKMEVDASVNEADIGKVKDGQPVEFTVDAFPDITFKGTVFQVRNAPITVSNVVTYTVVIQVDNKDLKLKPGMTANTTITTNQRKGVLRLPNAALRVRMPASVTSSMTDDSRKQAQKGPGVWILDGDKPKRLRAVTGLTDGSHTEISDGELQEGMTVITDVTSKDKKAAPASSTQGGRPPRMF